MHENEKLQRFKQMNIAPESDPEYSHWLSQSDVPEFLCEESSDDMVIIYAASDHGYIISTLVENYKTSKRLQKELPHWKFDLYSTWGVSYSRTDVSVTEPMSNFAPDILKASLRILIQRSYDELKPEGSYFELEQKISHLLQIHFIEERNSWCRLDENGDVEDVVKITGDEAMRVVLMSRNAIAEISGLENYTLLRMFDFSRFRKGNFWGWPSIRDESTIGDQKSIIGNLTVCADVGSFSRGVHAVKIANPKKVILQKFWNPKKKYASFVIHDIKNSKVVEVSASPKSVSNYFTKSSKPFEMSPAFFRPEVLLKYKSDRAKYKLESREITCRGAWHLKTYDINDAGQVHTYIGYLGNLPYNEQLHWKQFNEPPKDGISMRAFETDMLGKWSSQKDSLAELKITLRELEKLCSDLWSAKSPDSFDKSHYPVSESADEWSEELLNLDQLLVEGFNKKWPKAFLQKLGHPIDPKHRELRLIEQCLISSGYDYPHAVSIMRPFHSVHNLRSLLKGHSSGSDAAIERKNAKKEFGSYKNHFVALVERCKESMEEIKTFLQNQMTSS